MTTTLYRFFDADSQLLYVGIAGNPGRRFHQHAKEKHWWTQVAASTMQHFNMRVEAERAEELAIRTERPLYNVTHNDAPVELWARANHRPDRGPLCGTSVRR